jgi:hypothetical protein
MFHFSSCIIFALSNNFPNYFFLVCRKKVVAPVPEEHDEWDFDAPAPVAAAPAVQASKKKPAPVQAVVETVRVVQFMLYVGVFIRKIIIVSDANSRVRIGRSARRRPVPSRTRAVPFPPTPVQALIRSLILTRKHRRRANQLRRRPIRLIRFSKA